MSCKAIPGSSNNILQLCPKQTHLQLFTTRRGGLPVWTNQTHHPRRNRRCAGLCSSYSTTRATAAAVEEEGSAPPWRGNFYQLLGVSEGGSFSDIKKAYKEMARKYHPDVSPPDRTEEYTRLFIEVHEAYETLSDPRRRALYDQDLARGLHLAFSTRRRFDQELEEKSEWRNHWQDQIAELEKRSMNKDTGENLSWAAQMRRQRAESQTE